MSIVNVGVIGLGEIAQIVHLPVLHSLRNKFKIAALCDVSEQLLSCMGKEYNVSKLYTDAHKLTEQEDLDAVFILNSNEYHTECAVSAAKNEKHIFIEKPLCYTTAEAEQIIKARNQAGIQVMVGYMRRFAPAFLQATAAVKNIEKINYVRVRDIIGASPYFIKQTSTVVRPNDIPDEARADKDKRRSCLLKEATGNASEDLYNVYSLLCGLSSHDISAMRELIGIPKRVLSASHWNNGLFINAIFEYEGFNTMFETGVDHSGRFDAHIEVYGSNESVKIQYNTPYIRHLPTTLTVSETIGKEYRENVIRPTYTDPYTLEVMYFHDVVTKGLKPKTSPEDALEDLKLFKMMINAMQNTGNAIDE